MQTRVLRVHGRKKQKSAKALYRTLLQEVGGGEECLRERRLKRLEAKRILRAMKGTINAQSA